MKAFPRQITDGWSESEMGMDLRDYFAAKAMQTFLMMNGTVDSPTDISEDAYRLADVMMKVRAK